MFLKFYLSLNLCKFYKYLYKLFKKVFYLKYDKKRVEIKIMALLLFILNFFAKF